MPVAVAVLDQWSDGKRTHVIGSLTPSGYYPAGGDIVDFRPVVQSGQAPIVFIPDPVSGGLLLNGDQGTFGASLLKCRTPNNGVGAAVKAATALTGSTGAFTSGKIVTLGAKVYTFRTALSVGPTIPNEILLGINYDASLHNLFLAITGGAGSGTEYSTGTVAHTLLTAADVSSHIVVVTAIYGGVTANALVTTTNETNLAITGGTMGAGTVPGAAAGGAADLGNADWPILTAIGFYAIFNQLL